MTFLGGLQAADEAGLAQLLAAQRPNPGSGRVFLLGDFFDLEPSQVLSLLARGRELSLLQVLAPDELAPEPGQSVDWRDPEGDGRRRVQLDGPNLAHYERAMEGFLESWGSLARHPTVQHCVHPSGRDFERTLARVLVR